MKEKIKCHKCKIEIDRRKPCPKCGWQELEVIILCGGKGTRMGEVRLRPKKLAFDVEALAEFSKQIEQKTAKAIFDKIEYNSFYVDTPRVIRGINNHNWNKLKKKWLGSESLLEKPTPKPKRIVGTLFMAQGSSKPKPKKISKKEQMRRNALFVSMG